MSDYPTHNDEYDKDYDDDGRTPILPNIGFASPNEGQLAAEAGYFPQSSTPLPQVKRWKTVKKVELYKGNLVLDCPVPKKLLSALPKQNAREFTHMRYTGVTCDPSDFVRERFTLRQTLFTKPRATELFIVVTMYNEDEILFARTMRGVIKNIQHLQSRSNSKTWGEEGWKKVVVCVVSDGRLKINDRTKSLLAAMGCYQDGIAKNLVGDKPVTAHLYEVKFHINGRVYIALTKSSIQLKLISKSKMTLSLWYLEARIACQCKYYFV